MKAISSLRSLKPLPVVGCLVCTAMVGSLIYLVCDTSISLAYSRANTESARAAFKSLSYVVQSEWEGLSEERVLGKLTALETKSGSREISRIKLEKDEGLIWYGDIRFEFRDGKLVRVW